MSFKKIIIIFSLLLGLLAFGVAAFIYEKTTEGFNARQIISKVNEKYFIASWGKKELALSLFEKPFYYLGKGCQTYVFASEDGRYVLKFLKQKHLCNNDFWEKIPFLKRWASDRFTRKEDRIKNLFCSFKIAYEKLSQEGGLIFVHLNKEPFINRHITLVNKLGFPETVYLDECQFIIQKKALPLTAVFKNISSETELSEKIDHICTLFVERMKKGVHDNDRSVAKNMAFDEENNLFFIDLGQLSLYPNNWKISDEQIQKELLNRLHDMKVWAEKHAPHIIPVVLQKMEKISIS